jgi:hypothetical protein
MTIQKTIITVTEFKKMLSSDFFTTLCKQHKKNNFELVFTGKSDKDLSLSFSASFSFLNKQKMLEYKNHAYYIKYLDLKNGGIYNLELSNFNGNFFGLFDVVPDSSVDLEFDAVLSIPAIASLIQASEFFKSIFCKSLEACNPEYLV